MTERWSAFAVFSLCASVLAVVAGYRLALGDVGGCVGLAIVAAVYVVIAACILRGRLP